MPETPTAARIAIVIPYFQKGRGILRQCIQSILAQRNAPPFTILVVDDASPIPAVTEIGDLASANDNLQIVEQNNAGPGAARNKGLDLVPPGTPYVAFLDSDDCWAPNYLDQACSALDAGFDLFFADTARTGFDKTRFLWHEKQGRNLDPNDYSTVNEDQRLRSFDGSFFDYALVRSNIISTSALAYRFDRNCELRFNTALFNGQDRLFKLHLAHRASRIAFSPEVLATEGSGVNIFDSARWGATKSLRLLLNYIRLSKIILEEFSLQPEQIATVRSQLRESRYSMTASLLHLLKNRQHIDWQVIRDAVKEDPVLIARLPAHLIRIVMKKIDWQRTVT